MTKTKIYILKKEADERILELALEVQRLKRSNASLQGHLKKTKEELKGLQYLNGYESGGIGRLPVKKNPKGIVKKSRSV